MGRYPLVVPSSDTEWGCLPMLIRYECDVACTPMIVSDSFVKSQKARDVDFTTHPGECGEHLYYGMLELVVTVCSESR